MMNKINFWSEWKGSYRSIYRVLLFLFIILLAFTIYSQYNSYDIAYPKEIVRKTQSIEVSTHNVQNFVFDLQIPARAYIIFQSFLSLDSGFNQNSSYILLFFVFVCFSILMSSATYLSRWWFMIFQAVFVVWLITLKLQYLELFGLSNQLFTFLFVGLFLIVGYYYHAFKEDAGFFQRWLSFALLLLVLIITVLFSSQIEAPLVFMMHHGIIVPIILAIIFIFNVAYDIILHILYLLAANKTKDGSSNLLHFIVISLLYLIYVGLTFAKNDYLISIDIIYLNEFLLLAFSAILGVWGFRKRSELIEKQLIFRPLGGYVYLSLAILTFAVLSWIFINANDPLIDTFEDMIIFSHLGFGVLFFFYVLYNFVGLLKAGHGIYPVVFRPVNIPYNLVRAVGFGVVIVLVLRSSYLPYYQAVSGYYNGLADYYAFIGEEEKSNTTFKIARQYAVTSHKHNFEIGVSEYKKKNWAEASTYFSQANYKRPSVQAYLNKVQAQLNANLVFESLFTLEDAQKDFPNNAYILNMKGLIYEKLNKIDSSFIYFDAAFRADNGKNSSKVAEVNRLALFAKNGIDEELPAQADLQEKDVPYQANYLALANRKRYFVDSLDLEIKELPEILTYNDFSFIFNATLNKSIANKDFDADSIVWWGDIAENKDFRKSLLYAASQRLNYAGKINEAYSYIYELENDNISDAGFYYLLHGLWLMEQGAFQKSVDHFSKAEELKQGRATTFKVIALILQSDLYQAAQQYQKQLKSESISEQILERDPLYQFLLGDPAKLPESFTYLWLKYNTSLQPNEKDSIINRLQGSSFLKLLRLDEVENKITKGAYDQAESDLNAVDIPANEEGLIIYKNNLMALLACVSDNGALLEAVDEEKLSTYPYNYKTLWEAHASFKSSADSTRTEKLMSKLGHENAFFESGVLYSANYFNSVGEEEKAYDILVESSRLNDNSIKILKAYTLQALKLNLISYAEESLAELERQLSAEELSEFLEEYYKIEEEIKQQPW